MIINKYKYDNINIKNYSQNKLIKEAIKNNINIEFKNNYIIFTGEDKNILNFIQDLIFIEMELSDLIKL